MTFVKFWRDIFPIWQFSSSTRIIEVHVNAFANPMFESSFCKQLEKEELAHDPFCECFRIVASLFELVLCMIKNVQDRFRDELSLNPILSFNDGLMWKAPVRSRFAQDSHFRIIILFSK
jgi:hypothetical protein